MPVNKRKEVPKEINILALDVATNCGWAVSKEIHGCWDLSVRKDESGGMRLLKFRKKVIEVIEQANINFVVFERTAGFHKNALIVQAELHGVLKVLLDDLKINYRAYSATEIKKFATGKGNANKVAMISSAKEKYLYLGSDDNVADALHILHLAIKDYK